MPFAGLKLGASTRREDRMLFGYSDGATWALTTGLKNPAPFGAATALSIGWEAAGEHIGVANVRGFTSASATKRPPSRR